MEPFNAWCEPPQTLDIFLLIKVLHWEKLNKTPSRITTWILSLFQRLKKSKERKLWPMRVAYFTHFFTPAQLLSELHCHKPKRWLQSVSGEWTRFLSLPNVSWLEVLLQRDMNTVFSFHWHSIQDDGFSFSRFSFITCQNVESGKRLMMSLFVMCEVSLG